MKKWILRAFGLFLVFAPVLLLWLAGTETGLRCLVLAGNRLSAGLLTIGSASGTLLRTIRLEQVRYADGIDTVTIASLDLAWEPARLLDGQLRVRSIRGSDVRVLLGDSTGETILAPFSPPFELTVDTILADKIAIFSGQEELWTIARATAGGLAYRHTAIQVADLSLTSDAFTLQAKGELRTEDAYPVQLAVDFKAHPDGYQPMAAHGTIKGPLNGLLIEAEAQAPFPARLDGRLDRLLAADTTWQARLSAPELVLSAISRDWPEQRFAQVAIEGRGTLDDYFLHVQSQAGVPSLSGLSTLTADLKGNANGLAIDGLHLGYGPARLLAKASLSWTPLFSWQAELSGSHLNPGLFFADWPGDFTGSLTTSGQSTDQGWSVICTVPSIQGTLRGFPLTGNGELSIIGNRINIPQLNVKSGNSVLRASGRIDETVDLDLRLDSNNLAELWPGAKGSVKALARVAGPRATPRIDARITGDNLSSGDYALQTLNIDAKGALAGNGGIELLARAGKLRASSVAVDAIRLLLKGSMQEHTLELNAENKAFSAGLLVQGALKENRWQATLNRSHLTSREYGNWQQRQPSTLTLDADNAEIKPLCLQSAAAGTLCVDATWQPAPRPWRVHGTVSSLSLELLATNHLVAWPLAGRLNAEIDLTGQQARLVTGKITASSDGMQLRIPLPDGGTHQLTWKKNVLSAQYNDNKLQTTLDSEFVDASALHAELTATGAPFTPATFLRAPVNGSLRLNLQDLRPLAMLADQIVQPTGALRGQFTVSGLPTAPTVNGQMELSEGHAEIPPLGITLSPLQLKMTSDGKSTRLIASAQSGGGMLHAESVLQLGQLTTGIHNVRITGENFKAARLPGIDLDVSPDLALLFGPQKMEVRGTVAIPRARITSIDFHQATSASDDMVVVDEPDTSSDNTATTPLFTDITLVAGDDVRIDAYGLKGTIVGKLELNGQPGRPETGNGTLAVHNGSFTIYGRRLKIDLGRLHFAGGPLTNPGIELRSEKKGEKVTTGVLVSGFLQKPEMHFYSSPVLEQSAIITNLLESTAIGGETRQDTGFIGTAAKKVGLGGMASYFQGLKQLTRIDEIKLDAGEDYDSFSLVFGSWLTPDFYVSYGKDLVKESGSFNTRYTLGKGFSFLTETGASHSGGDIKYEFEH
ncbi:MAG: translocation/assembly module TamB domain-containing protein [Desulfobulbus sp.]|jgi:translocation and assembly module TamB|uniref:translocation/assembly module TamB domain-containing protein n=1 Tax=Desulfobulbus sp. TaxID=895 RepID=UPI00283C5F4E|nr:translocation/assembly module TamB domain-containing protein [Desulfobulbus sp.]MDR2549858.1 translocation/assembly module TamB domain-containing protein [Desulfobulbus sp.]